MNTSELAKRLRDLESVVLALIAVVLLVLGVILLGSSIISMVSSTANGSIANTGIEVLNSVLLVMMIVEIFSTVTMSLESHTLTAEPFLVIGAIAAIRRMLVITAESTNLELTNPDAFRSLLLELGLLALTVVALAIAILILRRAGPPPEEKHEEHSS